MLFRRPLLPTRLAPRLSRRNKSRANKPSSLIANKLTYINRLDTTSVALELLLIVETVSLSKSRPFSLLYVLARPL